MNSNFINNFYLVVYNANSLCYISIIISPSRFKSSTNNCDLLSRNTNYYQRIGLVVKCANVICP